MKYKSLHEFTQMSKAYDRIALARQRINDSLEAKYGYNQVHIDYDAADGIILVHHEEENSPIGNIELEVLLSDKITAEQGLAYLKTISI